MWTMSSGGRGSSLGANAATSSAGITSAAPRWMDGYGGMGVVSPSARAIMATRSSPAHRPTRTAAVLEDAAIASRNVSEPMVSAMWSLGCQTGERPSVDTERAQIRVHLHLDGDHANVSLDLILAVPGETPAEWEADLAAAVALAPEHVSTYALTYEERTPFAAWRASGSATSGIPSPSS